MSNDNIINVHETIAALNTIGRRYTDARNALIARCIAAGDKQSDVVAATRVDKGDVSRIAKVVNSDAKAKGAALRLKVNAINAGDPASLLAAGKVGETYFRRVKRSATGSTGSTAPKALADGDSSSVALPGNPAEEVDVLAIIDAFLLSSADRNTLVNRAEVARDAIARAFRERSDALKAEADALKAAEREAAA